MNLFNYFVFFKRENIIPKLSESKGRKMGCQDDLDQGLSKHQEMGFTPVTKVLQSNEGT